MVNKDLFDNKHFLGYKDAKETISNFLNETIPDCILADDQNFSMGFLLSFKNDQINASFYSDRGDLSYKLLVNGKEIELHKFEPLLSNLEWFSRKNILFLLATIKNYINSLSKNHNP